MICKGITMEIRKSQKEDLSELMRIICQAKDSLKKLGISQWQDGYPNESTILDDINNEISYVLIDNGKILATAAIAFCHEPTYDNIFHGSFHSSDNYAVLHRIAVDNKRKKEGLAEQLITFTVSLCKKNHYNWIRVDTHEGNIPMQNFLKKQGFQYCGIIYLSPIHNDETKRLAYDYQIL